MKSSRLLFVVIAVVILAGLFFLMKPDDQTSVQGQVVPVLSALPVAQEPMPAAPQVFELQVAQGRLVSGPAVIRLHQGDRVTLRITSDQPDELHLHGYDLHADLPAGKPVELNFTATLSGRFDYELHHAQLELGALEVQP